jgi:FkbM family methyltransferase
VTITPASANRFATIGRVDLYGQEPEARLLATFISRLENRVVIDVGAECGAFTEVMVEAGASEIHAIEPEPRNAQFLRERFGDDPRVSVHEWAINVADGEIELHMSTDAQGAPMTYGHSMLERDDTDEIAWGETITVPGRSLASLSEDGVIPKRVGILKVDTEGNDLAVIAGMGDLESDVVMVEHWQDLPQSLGPCPWTSEEMISALRQRGFSHFAFVVHRGEFVILQWDDGDVPAGHMGNIIFLHDRVSDRLLVDVLDSASTLAKISIEKAEMHASAAAERLEALEALKRERDVQADAAQARLTLIDELSRDLEAKDVSDSSANPEVPEQR